MRVANDYNETRSVGSVLAATGGGLLAAASRADFGSGAGGDAAPRTDAALGSLARDWQAGLRTLSSQVEALGAFVDLVATAFQKSD